MLESLFQQQTRQHLRMRGGQQQPWLSQRKKTKKKKNRHCAAKKKKTGCGDGDGNALAAPSTARALSLRVSQQSPVAWFRVCVFLPPIAFSGVAGRALFVFVLSAQQKALAKGESAAEKETPRATTVRLPLLFYVECN